MVNFFAWRTAVTACLNYKGLPQGSALASAEVSRCCEASSWSPQTSLCRIHSPGADRHFSSRSSRRIPKVSGSLFGGAMVAVLP